MGRGACCWRTRSYSSAHGSASTSACSDSSTCAEQRQQGRPSCSLKTGLLTLFRLGGGGPTTTGSASASAASGGGRGGPMSSSSAAGGGRGGPTSSSSLDAATAASPMACWPAASGVGGAESLGVGDTELERTGPFVVAFVGSLCPGQARAGAAPAGKMADMLKTQLAAMQVGYRCEPLMEYKTVSAVAGPLVVMDKVKVRRRHRAWSEGGTPAALVRAPADELWRFGNPTALGSGLA